MFMGIDLQWQNLVGLHPLPSNSALLATGGGGKWLGGVKCGGAPKLSD